MVQIVEMSLIWTNTIDDIITKVKRGRATLTESATHH
jgi:hypothetical protein